MFTFNFRTTPESTPHCKTASYVKEGVLLRSPSDFVRSEKTLYCEESIESRVV
jgi:hypothetical protein